MKKKTTRAPKLERPVEPKSSVAPPETLADRSSEVAALVLEVLAGERASGDAAEELGVSLSRYYLIERRAVRGLVSACSSQPRGPRRDPARVIEKLKLEVARLERECRRSQSLLRISQRNTVLGNVLGSSEKPAPKREKKRRRRQIAARALVLASGLRECQSEKKSVDPHQSPRENGKEERSKKS